MKRLLAWLKRPAKDVDSGMWGEREAERHLRAKGYHILGRRVRIGDRDELDLVAEDGKAVVFVEVKTRKTEDYGRPAESVKRDKRHTMSRAAGRYLKHLRRRPRYIRFDVVEVVGGPCEGVRDMRHIENAFQLDRPYELPY